MINKIMFQKRTKTELSFDVCVCMGVCVLVLWQTISLGAIGFGDDSSKARTCLI